MAYVCPSCKNEAASGDYCSSCGARLLKRSAPIRSPTSGTMELFDTRESADDPALLLNSSQAAQAEEKEERPAPAAGSTGGGGTVKIRSTQPSAARPASKESRPTEDPFIGTVLIGQYEIRKKLGEGTFGAVYLAEQVSVRRKAVIKLLKAEAPGPEVIRRFENEAAVLATLESQHVVRLYNFGQMEDGRFFLAMEYGGNRTLEELIRTEAPLDPVRALRITEQICQALQEAHTHPRQIVHRDIKPANLLLSTKDGRDWVKVVDLGIAKLKDEARLGELAAKLTADGMVIGTPAYFSPEQASGQKAEARSDLYSLSVVLYEMLTRALPVPGKTPLDFVRTHIIEPPIPFARHGVQQPPWLEQLVLKGLQKKAAARFASADQMREELAQARRRLEKSREKTPRGLIAGAAGGVLLLAVGGGWVALRPSPMPPEPPPAVVDTPPKQQPPPQQPARDPVGTAIVKQPGSGQLGGTETKPEVRTKPGAPKSGKEVVAATPVKEPGTSPLLAQPAPATPVSQSQDSDDKADTKAAELVKQAQGKPDAEAERLLKTARALAASKAVKISVLRSLGDLMYQAGKSKAALEAYQALVPLLSPAEAASLDNDRIKTLRAEVDQ